MKIQELCEEIERVAPLHLQESYDNAGVQLGDTSHEITGVLLCLDVTEEVVDEAIAKGCNLILSHHPLIFGGLKKIIPTNMVGRTVLKAIQNNIVVYSAHTNLDNAQGGVNTKIAEKIGLKNIRPLLPLPKKYLKLVTYVPTAYADKLRSALFSVGAGSLGDYDSCSYTSVGEGTFRATATTCHPFVGNLNETHHEPEVRLEMAMLPSQAKIVTQTLLENHPYEEPAFDFYPLEKLSENGTGAIGELETPEDELSFLQRMKETFHVGCVRHTALTGKKIKRVALVGGAGSGFINAAIAQKTDVFLTGDVKYHEFFSPENNLLLADLGHFETEQYTKEIFFDIIRKKSVTFAIYFSDIKTNPINYL